MTTTIAPPRFTSFDTHLWNQSQLHRAYQRLGAHLCEEQGQAGTHFSVWAPNAVRVSVIGDFNSWDEQAHPLELHSETGVWQGFIAGVEEGTLYKYSILSSVRGYKTHRSDPYGFAFQKRPDTASIVWDITRHEWNDQAWMSSRVQTDIRHQKLSIYEVHLGSWRRRADQGDRWLTYREMAEPLAKYCQEMGFTHVELLPVTEHPYDGSWGYQSTGYFAPTSRHGTPDDFKFLVDVLHQHGIGVILDWVPAHFPTDGFALNYFDGTHLYEHADPRRGMHPEWGTLIFNYGRHEVVNFLISSALFWLDVYHIDGIRVDAVASMLYLDYGRQGHDWVPNVYGGRENLEAVEFLKKLNFTINDQYPGVFTTAEESTAWPLVTGSVADDGLGFTLKWNMGWMNDTLSYFEYDPIHRQHHHNKLTFGLVYQYSENFLLPLSHDEVVHLKKALLTKMPGEDPQRVANLKALYGYMWGYPGKKLLFMGGEFGQWSEWNFSGSLDWHLLELEAHRGIQEWVKALNGLYHQEPALWERDNHPEGFRWIDCHDRARSLISFLRFPKDGSYALAFVCNFTPVPREDFRLGLPWKGEWEVLLSSEELRFGGSQQKPENLTTEEHLCHDLPNSVPLNLPALSVMVLKSSAPHEKCEEKEGLES